MRTVVVDYNSGNLHSAAKAFERMATEQDAGDVIVSSDPGEVLRADRVVLPGDGAFPSCRAALVAVPGLFDAIRVVVREKERPFMGICIGMQMMADMGHEHGMTPGFGWIGGDVVKIVPADPALKVPHMGWNDLVIDREHAVLRGVKTGDHAYFVHSYHLRVADRAHLLAHADYGGPITAIIGRDNMVGTQFHPEKSQKTGLGIIANFLTWRP